MYELQDNFLYFETHTAKGKETLKQPDLQSAIKVMTEIPAFYFESWGHERKVYIKNAQGLADLHKWLIHRYDDYGPGNIHFQRRFQHSPFETVKIEDGTVYIKFNKDYFSPVGVDEFAGKFIGKGGKNIKDLSKFIGKKIIILKEE